MHYYNCSDESSNAHDDLFAGLEPERQGASSRYSYLLLFDPICAGGYFWSESGETNLLEAYKSSYGYRYVGILSAPIQIFFIAIAYRGNTAYRLTRDSLIPKRLFCVAMHYEKYLRKYGGLCPSFTFIWTGCNSKMASEHESTESSGGTPFLIRL